MRRNRFRKLLLVPLLTLSMTLGNGTLQESYAIDEIVGGTVIGDVVDTLYIEVTGHNTLKKGDIGFVRRAGRQVAYAQVIQPGSRQVYLQIISRAKHVEFHTGDNVEFETRLRKQPRMDPSRTTKWAELDRYILGEDLYDLLASAGAAPTAPATPTSPPVVIPHPPTRATEKPRAGNDVLPFITPATENPSAFAQTPRSSTPV